MGRSALAGRPEGCDRSQVDDAAVLEVLTLARQEQPDMSGYADPEIATTIRKDHHAGIIVRSPQPERLEPEKISEARRQVPQSQ